MLKKIFLIVALFLFSLPSATGFAKQSKTNYAFVNVPVANVWRSPAVRKIDIPSTKKNPDLSKWIKSMSYNSKLGLLGKLDTQVLYGERVIIKKKKAGWTQIAIPSQPVPGQKQGYIGWVPSVQLAYSDQFDKNQTKPFAVIKSNTAFLYNDTKLQNKNLNLSFNTRLPIIESKNGNVLALTPSGNKKWLKKGSFHIFKDEKAIAAPTGKDIVQTGRQFLKLPYLWAGMSGFGYDCSGFTYSMHKAHGIKIPRDSSAQAKSGKAIKKSKLQPGDLLFFAHKNGKGKVHHVAMYAGNGKMIHSPNTASTIRIDSINAPGYKNEYAGARRYHK